MTAGATDEELMQWASHGDEAAFVLLYRRRQQELYRYAYRMTGSAASAAEAVQEVFLTVVRQPKRWNAERGMVRPFLFGIARNVVLRTAGYRTTETFSDEDVSVPSADAGPLEVMVNAERIEELQDTMLALPSHYREVLVLCDLEEMSYEEAAKALECPVGTVRSRLARARTILAARMKTRMEA